MESVAAEVKEGMRGLSGESSQWSAGAAEKGDGVLSAVVNVRILSGDIADKHWARREED